MIGKQIVQKGRKAYQPNIAIDLFLGLKTGKIYESRHAIPSKNRSQFICPSDDHHDPGIRLLVRPGWISAKHTDGESSPCFE